MPPDILQSKIWYNKLFNFQKIQELRYNYKFKYAIITYKILKHMTSSYDFMLNQIFARLLNFPKHVSDASCKEICSKATRLVSAAWGLGRKNYLEILLLFPYFEKICFGSTRVANKGLGGDVLLKIRRPPRCKGSAPKKWGWDGCGRHHLADEVATSTEAAPGNGIIASSFFRASERNVRQFCGRWFSQVWAWILLGFCCFATTLYWAPWGCFGGAMLQRVLCGWSGHFHGGRSRQWHHCIIFL